ncbi:hypothetical protein [Streptomyces sp. NPDC088923]|uniref:hypothetical protein n=1 Tax=Streptomyces sp. NPDC088923 TaxID=3365913 RepID=UPI0037FC78F4
MLCWDYESEGWESRISSMPEAGQRELALSCLERTLDMMDAPVSGEFSGPSIVFFRDAVQDFRAKVASPGQCVAVLDEENFFEALHVLPDIDPAPGVPPLVMAFSDYADCLRNRPLSSREVLGIMSSCYEVILNETGLPRVTVEAERENEMCRRALQMQRQLIGNALS